MDRRFANLLYVKIVQVLLHFAKVILDFTHRNHEILSSAPHELVATFFRAGMFIVSGSLAMRIWRDSRIRPYLCNGK